MIAYANKSDPADALSKPLAFGSHRSKLIAALRDIEKRVVEAVLD